MADIDIKRKEGPGPWPWVIGVVVLALIVWAAWEYMGDDTPDLAVTTEAEEQVTPAEPTEPAATTAESAGQRFLAWVRDSADDAQQMGREHEYTRAGLERLTGALEGLLARDTAPDIRQHLETVREQRRAVAQSDPSSTEHAAQVERAFEAAVNALERLSERPRLQQAQLTPHVDAARAELDRLDANRPLLEQRNVVHQFFEHMARAIEAAERHATA